MVSATDVTFVMTWCERSELGECLVGNREALSLPGRELLIIHPKDSWEELNNIVLASGVQSYRALEMPTADFNKSCWLNLGVHHVRSRTVFLVDADVILEPGLVENAIAMLPGHAFVTVRRGIEREPERHPQTLRGVSWLNEQQVITKMVFRNGKSATTEFWKDRDGRSFTGIMLIRKDDYIAVQGCNSALKTWGFEDFDLQIRLQAELGLPYSAVGTAIHLTHDIPVRNGMTERRNRGICVANYEHGNFKGTCSADVAMYGPNVMLREVGMVE
jgi:hypothetical protein